VVPGTGKSSAAAEAVLPVEGGTSKEDQKGSAEGTTDKPASAPSSPTRVPRSAPTSPVRVPQSASAVTETGTPSRQSDNKTAAPGTPQQARTEPAESAEPASGAKTPAERPAYGRKPEQATPQRPQQRAVPGTPGSVSGAFGLLSTAASRLDKVAASALDTIGESCSAPNTVLFCSTRLLTVTILPGTAAGGLATPQPHHSSPQGERASQSQDGAESVLGSVVGAAETLGLAAVSTARAGAGAVIGTMEVGASATWKAVEGTATAAANATGELDVSSLVQRTFVSFFSHYLSVNADQHECAGALVDLADSSSGEGGKEADTPVRDKRSPTPEERRAEQERQER
jgi:hypothetical protein